MLTLKIALPPYDRQCGWQSVDCAYISAGMYQGLLMTKRQYSDNLLNSLFKRPLERSVARILLAKALVELGHRSGYLRNVIVRAGRRWVLMEAGMIPASQTRLIRRLSEQGWPLGRQLRITALRHSTLDSNSADPVGTPTGVTDVTYPFHVVYAASLLARQQRQEEGMFRIRR